MSDDLVKRLLAVTDDATVNPDGPEAAARIAELEAALRKISAWHPTIQTMPRRRIGELRDIANAALEGKGNE
jgi:hypothetical protein